jgi:ABC-2 type transport system permease protein
MRYAWTLLRMSIGSAFARPIPAVSAMVLMAANNFLFFITFVIYFRNFTSLKGWVREDLALLIGVCCWAFGLAVFLAGGFRDLANTIGSGGLDPYLGRPRHPLPALLFSQSIPSGLGDMGSALVFWTVLGHRGWTDLPMLLLVGTLGAVVVAATATLLQCLAFWMPDSGLVSEELFQMFMMVAYYPEHPFGFAVRFLLLTVFPAGFVAMMPVEAVRDGDPGKLAACAVAALAYAGLAGWVFERGLRRYTSGSRIIELR